MTIDILAGRCWIHGWLTKAEIEHQYCFQCEDDDEAYDDWCNSLPKISGPNDLFEIQGNNSPDPPDDDDETHEPQDYTGDYPLEGGDGEDE